MKQTLITIIAALLTVGFLTGCVARLGSTPQSQATGDADPTPAAETTGAPLQHALDPTRLIGEEKAKAIALEKAGIPAEGVVFDRVELDRDNGIWHYEVEFKKDYTEYDVDIKADDGTVLAWETDSIR